MKRKLPALLLAMVMLAMMFSGCTSSLNAADSSTAPAETKAEEPTPAPEESTATPPAEAGYTLPLGDGSQTVSILSGECYHPTKSFSDILPIYQKYIEEMGVQLKWETVPGADYDATVSVRLAAGGADLPDVVRLPNVSDPAAWVTYIEGGTLLQLDPLLKFAPNITRLFWDYRPDIRKSVTWTDGNLYLLPTQVMGIEEGLSSNDFANPPAWEIRGDILAKHSLQVPTTIDEMYNVLKTIRDKEPDMIPYGQDDFVSYASSLATCWGLNLWDGFADDGTGKIVYQWIDPRMEEILSTLHQWYSENLLDKEPVGGTDGTWGSKAVSGKLFMTYANTGYAFVVNGELVKNVPGSGFHILKYPKAGNNAPFVMGYGDWNGAWAITSKSKDPELVIKVMDYMFYRDKSFIDQMYGVEGVDYEIKDGHPTATEYFTTEAAKDGNYVYSTGAYADVNMPQTYIKEYRLESYATFMKDLAYGDINVAVAYELGSSLTPRFPKLMVTPDENATIQQYMPDIDTFRTEAIAQFIRGEKPISEFASYVEAVNSMSIDQVVKIKQAQYDRYKAS